MNSNIQLKDIVSNCRKCYLHTNRTKSVLGEGNAHSPRLMLIGEAPGKYEDLIGRPFVSKQTILDSLNITTTHMNAGELLQNILDDINIQRRDIYITNVWKCRPFNNKLPKDISCDICLPYLSFQIKFIKPKVIVTLGYTATSIFNNKRLTNQVGSILYFDGIAVIPTWHPAYAIGDNNLINDIKQHISFAYKMSII